MSKDELIQLRIPAGHSAFSHVDFFFSSWIYEPGNTFFVIHLNFQRTLLLFRYTRYL